MNHRPNVPDEIDFKNKDYSFRADMRVNGWMFTALIVSVITDVYYSAQIKTIPPIWRAALALLPAFPILLWVRDVTQWVRGMDELHRRITTAAISFSVSATLAVVAFWHLLAQTGIAHRFFANFFDPNSVWVILSLMTVFYFRGHRFFNRRYQ